MSDTDGRWVELFRPKTLHEYKLWNTDERKVIERFVESPETQTGLIFGGPPGVGKTLLADLISSEFDERLEDDFTCMKMYASIDTGVDHIRDRVTSFCMHSPASLNLVILDEADRLSPAAQDSLRNVMDLYGDGTKFILTANNMNRVSDALKSRLTVVSFHYPDREELQEYLVDVSKGAGYNQDEKMEHGIVEMLDSIYPCGIRDAVRNLQMLLETGEHSGGSGIAAIAADLANTASSGHIGLLVDKVERLRMEQKEAVYGALMNLDGVKTPDKLITLSTYAAKHSITASPTLNLVACICHLFYDV